MSPGYPKMSRMSVLPMRSRQKPSSIFHHNDSLSVLTTLGHPCGVMTVRWFTTFPWPHARPVYTWRTSKVKRWCDIPALSSMYLAVSKWLDNVDASHDPQCSVSVTVAVWPVQMETYFTSGDPHQQTYIPQFYLVYTYLFDCLSDTLSGIMPWMCFDILSGNCSMYLKFHPARHVIRHSMWRFACQFIRHLSGIEIFIGILLTIWHFSWHSISRGFK